MATETVPVLIYGASDDCVEVDGAIDGADEFNIYDSEWVGTLTAPDGESLVVRAEYSPSDSDLEWRLRIENTTSYPEWPITFTERPGREGDPAIRIEVPAGTVLTVEVAD